MVSRDGALALGGFPAGNYYGGEDLALWMRLAAEAPVAVSDFVGCFYRRGIASLTRNGAFQNASDVSMKTFRELLEQHPNWPDTRKAALREYYNRLALAHGYDCLRAGEYFEGHKCCWQKLKRSACAIVWRRCSLCPRCPCVMPSLNWPNSADAKSK